MGGMPHGPVEEGTDVGLTLSQRHPDLMLPVKAIPLGHGHVTIIDPENWTEAVQWYTWRPIPDGNTWKAQGRRMSGGYRRYVYLHKLITGFDNRRVNLRDASLSQNQANRGLDKDNTAGFKGVIRDNDKRRKGFLPWKARMGIDGKVVYFGIYLLPEDAARAYDHGAVRHRGEFALTNDKLGLVSHSQCTECKCSCTNCKKGVIEIGWKLVRDFNEQWCRANGVSGQWRAAPDPQSALLRKIFEEAGEYAEHRDPAELYDLLDVVQALIDLADPDGVVNAEHCAKVTEMGGFGRLIEWCPVPAVATGKEAPADGD